MKIVPRLHRDSNRIKLLLPLAAILGGVATLHSLAGHADAPAGRYSVSADTVYDNVTKLTWQRVPGAPMTWKNALACCQSLSLSGGGWRLPTVPELQTLVEMDKLSPAIDTTAFPSTADWFWTSTPYAFGPPSPSDGSGSGDAWSVSFNDGGSFHFVVSKPFYVRCVR